MFGLSTRHFACALLGLLLLLSTAPAYPRQQGTSSVAATSGLPLDTTAVGAQLMQPEPEQQQSRSGGIARNFRDVTRQGGPVMYPIYVVFILGLGVIVYQFVRIFFDDYYAKPIKAGIDKRLSEVVADEDRAARVRELSQLLAAHPKSHLAKLLAKMCDLWHRDPSADSLNAEIQSYLTAARERYEIGKSFAGLLSDTAGALGLLGTVLGMYMTFMPGRLEASQIISGMGVALVTTISGLIVSIVLNFLISWANSTFHGRMERVMEHADLFRNRFGRGQSVTLSGPVPAAFMEPSRPAAQPVPVASEEPVQTHRRVPTRLRLISGNKQVGDAGTPLPKPLEVAVEDQFGKPMENLTVLFDTNGSTITFDNGETVKQVDTDFLGRAKVQAQLGKLVGRHSITVRVNGESNLSDAFEVESRPGPPSRLLVLSGNLQIGRPKARLPELLSLKLQDACENPVPGQTVVFEVVHNTGVLENSRNRLELVTDEEGVVATSLQLADAPGANIVRAWVKGRGAQRLETSFESLGRE